MTSRAAKYFIGLEPDNGRIILARFRTTHNTLTVITCYPSTNEADEEGRESSMKFCRTP